MAVIPVVALLLLLAVLGLMLQPLVGFVHGSWTDQYGAHSHGYLVLALSCFFAWRIVRSSPDLKFRPSPSAAIPLALVLAVAFAAKALFIGPIHTVIVPMILGLCVAFCLGWHTALRLSWPVLFLYFAMPCWGPLNPILQNLTTVVATGLVGLTGIPFYVEGNFVHLASGTFQIASGCSGLNYLIAALTIAATQCTLHLSTTAARIKVMVAAALAALCANWLRVASLIVIGDITEMRHYLIRVEHFWFGWVLFMALLAPVVLYGRRLAEREPKAAPGPVRARARALPSMRWAWASLAVVSLAALAVAAALVLSLQRVPPGFMAEQRRAMTPVDRFASGWKPHGVEGEKDSIVRGTIGEVEVFGLSYAAQTRDVYLGHPENTVTGEGWQITQWGEVELQVNGQPIKAVEYVGQLDEQQQIVWELPVVGGRMAQARVARTAAMLVAWLQRRKDAELWALHAACRGNCDRAREELRAVIAGRRSR